MTKLPDHIRKLIYKEFDTPGAAKYYEEECIECEILTNISHDYNHGREFMKFLFEYEINERFTIKLKSCYVGTIYSGDIYLDEIFGKTEESYIYELAERISAMTIVYPNVQNRFDSVYFAISGKSFIIPNPKFQFELRDYIFSNIAPSDKYLIRKTKAACKK